MSVRVDPYDYVTAADLLDSCSTSAVRVASSAVGSLRPFANMAGDDPGGEGWARGYDASTATVIEAVRAAASRLRGLDRGVMQTGQMHQQAEQFSAGNAAVPAGFSVRSGMLDAGLGLPPSAFGGDPSATPDAAVWEWIKDFVGNLWPNADVGKLTSASGAWTTIADDLTALATEIERADQPLASAQSVEVAGITTMVSGLATDVRALATEARSLSESCTEYAGDVESAHAEVWKLLQQLAVEIALTAGISAALALFTAGISAGVGAAALAVRVAVVGGRVVAIISRVSATAGRITVRFFAVQSRVANITVRIVGTRLGRDIVSSTVAATVTEAGFNGFGRNVFAAGVGAVVGGGFVGGVGSIARRLGRNADGLIIQTVSNAAGGGVEGGVSSLIAEGSFNAQTIVLGTVAGGAVGGGAAAFTRRGRGGAVPAGTPTQGGTTTSPGAVNAPAVPGAAPVGAAAGAQASVRTVDGPQVAGSTASSSVAGGAAPRADVDAPRVQGTEAMPPVAAAGSVVRPDVDAPRASDQAAADVPPAATAAARSDAPSAPPRADSPQPVSYSAAGTAPVRDGADTDPVRSAASPSDPESTPAAREFDSVPVKSDSADDTTITSAPASLDAAPDGVTPSVVETSDAVPSTPVGLSASAAPSAGTPSSNVDALSEHVDTLPGDLDASSQSFSDHVDADVDKLEADAAAAASDDRTERPVNVSDLDGTDSGEVPNVQQLNTPVVGQVVPDAQRVAFAEHNYMVAFFDEGAAKKYYDAPTGSLGAPGRPFFVMPVEDSGIIRNAHDAARYTGMSPGTEKAYLNRERVHGLVFPVDAIPYRVPVTADARGWDHFLEGGHTAVRTEGAMAGFLVNPVREFVLDGGTTVPAGALRFVLGDKGEWTVEKVFL
ncbi:hypothetical protein E3O06_00815 [Cryobacterium glaciale]|uniref:Outer membrane channel protein CpnT-like N-terminal domain-containing protein n=1 Tax=Cryobacterium glaciale TaxID=1259145 RepID=A0A4V3I908_9MICO|nr:hypothetical protein [Cryobacterium glaciale]TFB77327.1 hypothetical protein E3O06_00815 [Cryobacterium glaciale]